MPKTAKNRPAPEPTPDHSEILKKLESSWRELLEISKSGPFSPELLKGMAEVLDKQADLAEFLMNMVIKEADPASVLLLAALNDRATSKGAQKRIKRSLYRLQQKGLPAERQPKERPAGSGILKEIAPAPCHGYLSEFDEGGNRLAAMLIPKGIQGKVFLFVLINPEGELESLTVLEVNKKEAKRILADLEEQTGHTFFEAAPEHTAFVIKEAHNQGSQLDPSSEENWAAILNLLSGLKAVGQGPIIRSLLQPDQAAGMDTDRLLRFPETTRFFIKPELFDPYMESIQTIQAGVLIVSPEQKFTQIQNVARKAAEEIFQGPVLNRLIRFFEEAAYLYHLKGQGNQAGELFNAARSLETLSGSGENPFLIRLVERVLLPGQDHPLESGPKMETTPGGIIIPSWVNKEGLDR
jgi:hypothetical protein